MVDLKQINQDDPSYLIISPRVGKPTLFNLGNGGSVFVGSGSNCRLVLDGEGVQGIHCMIWMEAGKKLKVQDWNTGQTYLNNDKLTDEADFHSGDILTIADFRLIPVLSREFHVGIACDILELGEGWGDSVSPADLQDEDLDPVSADSTFPSLDSLQDEDELDDAAISSVLSATNENKAGVVAVDSSEEEQTPDRNAAHE
ncbi:MAG: FHA domain-containing protein, partial [Planctomycetota bacterium]